MNFRASFKILKISMLALAVDWELWTRDSYGLRMMRVMDKVLLVVDRSWTMDIQLN